MAEKQEQQLSRPLPLPGNEKSVLPDDVQFDDKRYYEKVDDYNPGVYQPEDKTENEYENDRERIYVDLDQARRKMRNTNYKKEDQEKNLIEIRQKEIIFKGSPEAFIKTFEDTHDEIRTEEETFIIVHLLRKGPSNSPILDGNLDQLAMLACCSSPRVVKRALDALLNEIFLSISDSSKNARCHNILKAEKIIRESFQQFMKVDNLKAKSHRMTTYAWLVTLVLLKCSKQELNEIQPEVKDFDKSLYSLQNDKEECQRNTFRYGIYLARESIKLIVQTRGKKDPRESLRQRIKSCEKILDDTPGKEEVMKLFRTINDEGSWLDIHVCLVFLQDLPKFHQFQGNPRPIILIQMLIEAFRERCSARKFRGFSNNPYYEWQFEILIYHLLLRLIRTSKPKAIIKQVLEGEQGCGGVFTSWIQNKSTTTRDESLVLMNLKKLCERAVFVATPDRFKQFITDNCKEDEKKFIEDLAILQLSATYRDKVFEVLSETQTSIDRTNVSTYDALMSGRKCLLKLHRHSKKELLDTNDLRAASLRKEIEIVQVLDAEPCPYIVQHFGSSTEAPMHMIVERTPKGDLLTYLQDLATLGTPPEAEVLLQIALDICNALIFLGEKNIIHCDLCAKNCFVFIQEGKLLTKLGDFHLARLSHSGPKLATTGVTRQHSFSKTAIQEFSNRYAVRWMAVEAIQSRQFGTASDVWSFGILLSEIFTFGRKPYVNMPNGLSLDNDEDVEKFILNGGRLQLHRNIPESIQVLIMSTMRDADQRPSFTSLKDKLMEIKFKDDTYECPAIFNISYDNYASDITQSTTVDEN